MTVKEIAKMIGKSRRSVSRWCELIGQNDQTILDKMTNALSSNNPSDFTLDETIKIMKAGKVSDFIIQALINETKRTKNVFDTSSNAIGSPIANAELNNELSLSLIEALKSITNTNNMILKRMDIIESKINSENKSKIIANTDQKLLPSQPQKIEVSIVDLPDQLSRIASAAINNKLKSDAKKKRLDDLQDDLFN